MIRVEAFPIEDRKSLRRFLRVPWRLYAPESPWVRPLDWERLRFLDRRRNPFFSFADIRCFLAQDGAGRDVGRIAAIDNQRYKEFHGRRLGFFGFFEAVDEASVCKALFKAAEGWLRERRCIASHGPVNPSMNHECGLLVDGFERPQRVLMPYNPPYYGPLIESVGYQPVQDLVAYEYEVGEGAPSRLERARAAFQKRSSFVLRPVNLKRFAEEVERVKLVYNESWAENYGFVPLGEDEVDWLARELRPFIAPDLCQFAEVNGETAGIMLGLPDVNQAIKPLGGRLFPFGWWKFLRGLRTVDAALGYVMGVRPRFRKAGIDYAFYAAGLEAVRNRGCRTVEMGWILADNLALVRPLERLGAKQTKRFRLYERNLE